MGSVANRNTNLYIIDEEAALGNGYIEFIPLKEAHAPDEIRAGEGIMITDYIEQAMKQAHYEILPDDGTFYGNIPGFQGVYANAPTLEGCREELREVLEGWILISLWRSLPIPVLEGIDLNVKQAV